MNYYAKKAKTYFCQRFGHSSLFTHERCDLDRCFYGRQKILLDAVIVGSIVVGCNLAHAEDARLNGSVRSGSLIARGAQAGQPTYAYI